MKVCKYCIPIIFLDVNWYLTETLEKLLPKLQKVTYIAYKFVHLLNIYKSHVQPSIVMSDQCLNCTEMYVLVKQD